MIENKTLENIEKHWNATLNQVLQIEEQEFEQHSQVNGVEISHYKGSERGIVIKGETIVENCNVEELVTLFASPNWEVVKEYDKKAKYFKEIDRVENENGIWSIRHFIFSSPSRFVSEREFLLVGHLIEQNSGVGGGEGYKGWLSTSIDEFYSIDELKDEKSEGVRGTNYFTMLKFQQIGYDVKCTMLVQSNPNGLIPNSLASQALHERPLLLFDVGQYLHKKNKLPTGVIH